MQAEDPVDQRNILGEHEQSIAFEAKAAMSKQ